MGGFGMAITWTGNIKQQFGSFDISHMKQVTGNALKLDDYESVKTWAGQIWVQVSGIPPNPVPAPMPPGNPWSDTYKQNFKTWMDTGMLYGTVEGASSSTAAAVTWTNTIKGQFRKIDIDHMKQVSGGSIDLNDYTSVKTNGDDIYGMVSTNAMPPGSPWTKQYIDNFKAWMDAGYPEN
jgi:hypothetical protein